MTNERYRELEIAGKGLTFDEQFAGWHFCEDWDGMLIGPGCPELDNCSHVARGDE